MKFKNIEVEDKLCSYVALGVAFVVCLLANLILNSNYAWIVGILVFPAWAVGMLVVKDPEPKLKDLPIVKKVIRIAIYAVPLLTACIAGNSLMGFEFGQGSFIMLISIAASIFVAVTIKKRAEITKLSKIICIATAFFCALDATFVMTSFWKCIDWARLNKSVKDLKEDSEKMLRAHGLLKERSKKTPQKLKVTDSNFTVVISADGTGAVIKSCEVETKNDDPISIAIPDKIQGMPVVEIDTYRSGTNGGFIPGTTVKIHMCMWPSKLGEIKIPDTVKVIGDYAFADLYQLQSVNFPKSLEKVGEYAFRGGYLKKITLPKTVDWSGAKNCFDDQDELEEVTIENGVKAIPYAMFYDCKSLKEITIPSSVKTIGGSAFFGCSSLKEITIEEGVEEILSFSFNGCEALKKIVIPASVKTIEGSAFGSCTGLEEIVFKSNDVQIKDGAFAACDLPLALQAELNKRNPNSF